MSNLGQLQIPGAENCHAASSSDILKKCCGNFEIFYFSIQKFEIMAQIFGKVCKNDHFLAFFCIKVHCLIYLQGFEG